MSSVNADQGTASFRGLVHAAARDELARWGIDRFSIVSLADRHHLDADEIAVQWADERALLIDVLLEGEGRAPLVPDTGSLHGDLLALVMEMAAYLTTGDGHLIQGSHLIADRHLDGVDIRRLLWKGRVDRLSAVFDAARQREELRDDVDAAVILEMLLAPINMRALFTGELIDEHYCHELAQLVWRATSSKDLQ
jgi:Tetracyclin repressor-like, C-terminal domain